MEEETLHPPSTGALSARLKHGVLLVPPLPGSRNTGSSVHAFSLFLSTSGFAGQALSILDIYLPWAVYRELEHCGA